MRSRFRENRTTVEKGEIRVKKILSVIFIAVGFGGIGGFGSKANLAWGSQIAFVSKAFNPDRRIVIINSDGTAPQPLRSRPIPNWPAWSPDGKKIAFIADVPSQLFLIDADGRNLERLRWNMPLRARPAWHPDGTKILFTRFEELMVFDLETKIETQVFFNGRDNGFRDAVWSPDGKQIAFTIQHDRQHDIYIIDVDGGKLLRLTDNASNDAAPAWSPDGRQIAFYSDRNLKPGICLMDAADGANFKRISFRGEHYPSWSPTGTHIAFWLIGESKVGVMRADGGNRRILFRGGQPSWRPDGSAAVNPVRKLPVAWVQVKLGL